MFQVVWIPKALNELAAIWLIAEPDVREAITKASYEFDQELQSDPSDKGESREGEVRIFFVFPIGFEFVVYPETKVVSVLHVWQIRRNK